MVEYGARKIGCTRVHACADSVLASCAIPKLLCSRVKKALNSLLPHQRSVVKAAVMTTPEGERTGLPTPSAPLTQADIPAVVQQVAEALMDQLKERRPPPSADGGGEPSDPREGNSEKASKSLPQSAVSPISQLINST